jgi:dTDP-4-amino-4,6-dideoxygalactose transaminase
VYFNEITNPGVTLPYIPSDRPHTWQTFHLLVDESINRDETILKLKEQGIGTNYGAQCIPAQNFYKKKYNLDYLREFPNAYTAFTKGIAIPLYEKLSKSQIKYIAKHINEIS